MMKMTKVLSILALIIVLIGREIMVNSEDTKDEDIDKEADVPPTKEKKETKTDVVIRIKRDGGTDILTVPRRGDRNIDYLSISPKKNKLRSSSSTARPVGAEQNRETDKTEEYREPYLPSYICDEEVGSQRSLEELYKGCMLGCQMKEPVKTTKLKMISPKPYKEMKVVTWYSAVDMYDMCHVDLWGNEHRVKGAVDHPLSDPEIQDIDHDIAEMIKLNQDIIHGKYPKAECSYWKDTQAESRLTRIRQTKMELYYAPEVADYFIHIPLEQVNLLNWDGRYDGPTGAYRWDSSGPKNIPCLSKFGDEIICLGSLNNGENLHCVTESTTFSGPYTKAWDNGCHVSVIKDTRGMMLSTLSEQTMSYSAAIQDKNPNIQSLGNAMTHLEELICVTGCGELTMVGLTNSSDVIVDSPIGIWKRSKGHVAKATQCTEMKTGDISVLTPVCTLKGVFGVKHLCAPGLTYYWDVNKLFATADEHPCLTADTSDLSVLIKHKENSTIIVSTFAGDVAINTKTGSSQFVNYNPNVLVNKRRWFPTANLGSPTAEDVTTKLEIQIMQQMRNLSSEYQESCKESSGPKILSTIGGTVWVLEKDIEGGFLTLKKLSKYIHILWIVLLIWGGLYAIAVILGLINRIRQTNKVRHVVLSKHARKSSDGGTS